MNTIQNIPLQMITEQYGTPLYLYDAEKYKESYEEIKTAFSEEVDVFYSIKANPNINICAEMRKLGACTEVCSYTELVTVIKAGFLPENIIFVGPAKTREDIVACLNYDIYAIVCESKAEFKLISEIATKKQQVARVALRINPSFSCKNALLKMGGQPSQFGMDENQVMRDKHYFLSMPSIHLMGIHIYNGTRILDPQVIAENTENVLVLSDKISKEWGVKFSMVDIGGGLGVPYFDNEPELNQTELKSLMHPIIHAYRENNPHTRIILESGRFLTAKAGIFISQILDVKLSKGEYFLITNGGTNCHMAAVGVGGLIKRNFPISLLPQFPDVYPSHSLTEYNITGPLCTPGDLVGKKVLLPDAYSGDFIIIHHSGAYGATASPVMFLSHGFPTEVLVKEGKPYLIRKPQKTVDFLSHQIWMEEEVFV